MLSLPKLPARAGLAALLVVTAGCMVTPPAHRADSPFGPVRAETQVGAQEVAGMLEELYPRVQAWLPGSRSQPVEVWVQASPALYRLGSSSYSEADGFWAEGAGRIHLRESADSLRRTLVHELVHASLGEDWTALPGTLEEGLCDLASARLCPESAPRMRAGRLSSAGFVTGGLRLEIELAVPKEVHALGMGVRFTARIRLEGEDRRTVDPLGVFEEHAGLSTSSLSGDEKKAYYGLAFLVAERIADRHGVERLYELCTEARRRGRKTIPTDALLEAADLDRDPATWSRAISEALGEKELTELVRMHPGFLVDALAQLFRPCMPEAGLSRRDFAALGARLSLADGEDSIDLMALDEVRIGLWERLRPHRATEVFAEAGILPR
jgi:hypothetical protein